MYAGWGFSQAFYWDQVYKQMGYSSLEDFLVGFWEGFFLDNRDPNNLLAMLWTWQNGNVGNTPGFDGDHIKALQSIKAKLVALPAEKDLYFPPEDEEYDGPAHPQRHGERDPGRVGSLRRWRPEPRGHQVHRRRAKSAARQIGSGA